MSARQGPWNGGAVFTVFALLTSPNVQASVDCAVATAGVAFGAYDPSALTPTDSAGGLTVRCVYLSGGAVKMSYTVALSPGGSGTYSPRRMRAGTAQLSYNLFLDVARSQVWGNGSGGTFIASGSFTVGPGVGNGIRENQHILYGRIPALQAADTGSYTDTIVVTLTF